MAQPKILVTGATGKTGGAVVEQLLTLGLPVKAVVRSRDARSERLERMGAETVVADLYDPDQLVVAMKGTTRAFYLPPFQPFMIQSATAFAAAARISRLEVIVGLGQWLASPVHPSILTRQHWLVDELFSNLPGIGFVRVNPGYYADNYLRLIDFASLLGTFPILTGHSRNAPPANEDIARVAAAVLANPGPHIGKRYRPTGPALLSAYEMAEIIQKVIGHRVRPVEMPFWMLTKAARQQGVDPFSLSSLRYYVQDHKDGAFEFGAPNDDVLRVTGRPAEDFATTVQRYAALPFAQRTFTNRLRAMVKFALVPFIPGYNLDRLERQQSFPATHAPRMAMDNQRWKAERRPPALQEPPLRRMATEDPGSVNLALAPHGLHQTASGETA
jgi:NAD(P)H dehydrogenase (quinone)